MEDPFSSALRPETHESNSLGDSSYSSSDSDSGSTRSESSFSSITSDEDAASSSSSEDLDHGHPLRRVPVPTKFQRINSQAITVLASQLPDSTKTVDYAPFAKVAITFSQGWTRAPPAVVTIDFTNKDLLSTWILDTFESGFSAMLKNRSIIVPISASNASTHDRPVTVSTQITKNDGSIVVARTIIHVNLPSKGTAIYEFKCTNDHNMYLKIRKDNNRQFRVLEFIVGSPPTQLSSDDESNPSHIPSSPSSSSSSSSSDDEKDGKLSEGEEEDTVPSFSESDDLASMV